MFAPTAASTSIRRVLACTSSPGGASAIRSRSGRLATSGRALADRLARCLTAEVVVAAATGLSDADPQRTGTRRVARRRPLAVDDDVGTSEVGERQRDSCEVVCADARDDLDLRRALTGAVDHRRQHPNEDVGGAVLIEGGDDPPRLTPTRPVTRLGEALLRRLTQPPQEPVVFRSGLLAEVNETRREVEADRAQHLAEGVVGRPVHAALPADDDGPVTTDALRELLLAQTAP